MAALHFVGITGEVVTPGSPGYDAARRNYNGRFNQYPLAVVYCADAQDVVNTLRWIKRHDLRFRIRDGGHSYEAFSNLNGGVVVDVSRLTRLLIDVSGETALLGAGWTLLPLYEALWPCGRVLPAGTCWSVGLSGLALGGGFGLLSRHMGLTCDSLTAVELVDARARVLCADENAHADLFWACRGGGGGSFGVATAFRFRLHPIQKVARYRFAWDFDELENVARCWQAWAPTADTRLSSALALPGKGQGDLSCSGLFVGPERDLRRLARPFAEATQPKSASFYTQDWIDAARAFAGAPTEQALFKNSSAYVYAPLCDAALQTLRRQLEDTPGTGNVAAFDACGGEIARISDDATAFPHRKALFGVQYQAYWSHPEEAADNIRWIERFRTAMLPFSQGAYVNYCDALIADWPDAYYGENLSRLEAVKRAYDPQNLFRFPQSVPGWGSKKRV